MDRIELTGLRFYAYHGVYDFEKERGQFFTADAVLETDLSLAGRSDILEDTVNYGELARFLENYLVTHRFDLLEAAADSAVRAYLRMHPTVASMELTLSKPEAPIPLDFENVSVTVRRKRVRIYLGLGSNMGDRKGYLDSAVRALSDHEDISQLRVSTYRETAPYGVTDQDPFLNAVAAADTVLRPRELFAVMQEIEKAAGRVRTIHWGPRTLDVDLLFYGREILDGPELCVPHPDLTNRRFVLEPMAELAPYLHHPIDGRTMAQLLAALPEEG